MDNALLLAGEPIFHPRYGFGVIESLASRDALRLSGDGKDGAEPYYNIRLMQGGTLFVPVARAEGLGLRRLENGLAAVQASLASPPQDLPANGRERLDELRNRAQAQRPAALACAVRDLLHQRRGQNLSNGEKTWLDNSCERMITEVSLVDRISVAEARAAIRETIASLSAG